MPDSGVGMHAFHQEVKHHHAESKIVVSGLTVYLSEVAALELGRSEVRFPNGAPKETQPARLRDLHGVAIYQSHQCAIRHKEVALVEIAYDVATGVNGVHDAGDVRSTPEQITPAKSRSDLLPILRVIELKHRHVRREVHPMHKETCADSGWTKQKALRPTDGNASLAGGRIGRWAAHHRLELR
jgi:hypothetical protein